jgi:predicted SnoaL-like aldol condensation-catalyzing enzyme
MDNPNRRIAIDFLHKALIEGKPEEAARLYLAPDFKQHNPLVADGPKALANSIAEVVKANPQATWEVKRTIAEGDLVVVHGHRRFNPEDRGAAVVNIFRIKDGKIVEQWNASQPVPEAALNDNTMF